MSCSPPRRKKRKIVLEPCDLATVFHGLKPAQASEAPHDDRRELSPPRAQPRLAAVTVLARSPPLRPRAPIRTTLERAKKASASTSTSTDEELTVDSFLALAHSKKRARTTYSSSLNRSTKRLRRVLPPSPSDADGETEELSFLGPVTRGRARLVVPSSESDSDAPSPPPKQNPRRLRSASGRLLGKLPIAHYLGDSEPVKKNSKLIAPYSHAKRPRQLSLARASQIEFELPVGGAEPQCGRQVRWRKKGAPARKASFLGSRADTAFAKPGGGPALAHPKPSYGRKRSVDADTVHRIFTAGDAFVQLVQQVGPAAVAKEARRARGRKRAKYAPLDLAPEGVVELPDLARPPTPPPFDHPLPKHRPAFHRRDSPHPVPIPVVQPKKSVRWDSGVRQLEVAFKRTLRVKARRPALSLTAAQHDDSATSQDGDNEASVLPPTPAPPVFRFRPNAKRLNARGAWAAELDMGHEDEAGSFFSRSESDDDWAAGLEMVPESEYDAERDRHAFDAEFAKIPDELFLFSASFDGARRSLPSPEPSSPPPPPPAMRRRVTFSSPLDGSKIDELASDIDASPAPVAQASRHFLKSHPARRHTAVLAPTSSFRPATPLRRSKTVVAPPSSTKPLRRLSVRPEFRLPISQPQPQPQPAPSASPDDDFAMRASSHEYEPPSPAPSSPTLSIPPAGQVLKDLPDPDSAEDEFFRDEGSWERLVVEAVEREEERMRWEDESASEDEVRRFVEDDESEAEDLFRV